MDVVSECQFALFAETPHRSGFEPNDNDFNMTYFALMWDLVNRLGDREIYTILDLHQDVMSSKFCLYDGIPLWVVNKSRPPKHAFPWPFDGPCWSRDWALNSVADAAMVAMQSLYDNYHHMRDDLADFWQVSALHWRPNKNVLGYEIINEPFPGDCDADLSLCLPGNAGRKNLLPL
jgi:endoglycosylceramidase